MRESPVREELEDGKEKAQFRANSRNVRQIEVVIANNKSTLQDCREAGITEQSYYHWRREYGELRLE